MAQIDLKNTTVYVYDGSDLTNATVLNSAAANADLTITPVHMASPAGPITITVVDPGAASQALSVSLVGRDITVNLATDGGSALASTATQVKNALDGNAAIAALISTAVEGTGAGLVDAFAKTTLTANGTNNYLQVKIGEGNLTYSEKRPVVFTRDRGLLDTVREDDDDPMDVTLDFTWEFLASASGATVPSVEEALRNEGPANDWINGSSDPCTPFAVNIAIVNDVTCGGDNDEIIEILEFYYEEMAHDLRAGTVSITGRANKTQATKVRVATALTP